MNINIVPPRVAFVDPRTGIIAREWYLFLLNMFRRIGGEESSTSIGDLEVMQAFDNLVQDVQKAREAETSLIEHYSDPKPVDLTPRVDAIEIERAFTTPAEIANLTARIDALEVSVQFVSVPFGVDHGTLSGLSDDDHIQYLLASAAGGRATFATNWTDLTDGGGTTLHTHTSSGITDFTEASQDAVGGALTDSTTVDFTYNDGANTITAAVIAVPVANETADTTCFPVFVTAATGDLAPKANANLTYNSNTGELGAVKFTSTVSTGTAPLTVASTTKVTNLNADSLDDQSGAFYLDSANFTGVNWTDLTDGGDTTLHQHSAVTVANEATDTTCFVNFTTATTGNLQPKTNVNMTFNSSTGVVTFASSVLTTTDINGGTVDGTVIGGSSAAAATVTTLSASGTVTLTGTAANIATGSNFISNGGTDAGLSFDASNNALLTANVFVGDSSNAFMTLGVTINQGGADNFILDFKSSDVAHGMTSLAETDTYSAAQKISATNGGLQVYGFSAATQAVRFEAIGTSDNTTKTTGGSAPFMVNSSKKSGTSSGANGADANLVCFQADGTTRFIFDNEGSGHADVEWTTFDEHDDLALIESLETHLAPDAVQRVFGDVVKYDLEFFARERLLSDVREVAPGRMRGMLNTSRAHMLEMGAIRSLARELLEIKAQLQQLLGAI